MVKWWDDGPRSECKVPKRLAGTALRLETGKVKVSLRIIVKVVMASEVSTPNSSLGHVKGAHFKWHHCTRYKGDVSRIYAPQCGAL